MPNKVYDLTGQRFGRWSVLKRSGNDDQGAATWLCRCDCGKERIVRGYALRYGHTKSCGCLQSEQVTERDWKHGESRTQLYRVWTGIKKRCSNPRDPAYRNYGGRGICLCSEWLSSFEVFRDWALSHGYRDGMSIDRIDNDGDYSPENCRWADAKTQCNNRRSNRRIDFNGQAHTISEWSDITGIPQDVIRYRLRAGWEEKRALTEKVRMRRWWKKPKDA